MNNCSRESAKTDASSEVKEASRAPKRLLPALVASGACGLVAPAAQALQLGELQVHSALGQPLRASIAYALSGAEQIHPHCIFIRPTNGSPDLPAIGRANVTLTDGRILLQGNLPVREPLLSLGIAVECPYTANLTRAYTLMLDPIPISEVRFAATAAPASNRETVQTRAPAAAAPAATQPVRRVRRSEAPIGPSTTYRVRGGDTLSGIASRIENRNMGLWDAVEVLFALNPDAFIDGDMNKLRAGSVLTIPSFDGENRPALAARETTPPVTAADDVSAGYEAPAAEVASQEAAPEAAAATGDSLPATAPEAVAEAAPADQTRDLRPGDIALQGEREFVAPIDTATEVNLAEPRPAAVEAPIESPVESPAGQESPLDAGQSAPAATANDGGSQLLYWLGGLAAFVVGTLLFLGRRRRTEPVPPATAADAAQLLGDDEPTSENRVLADVDYDISELAAASIGGRRLDADLRSGSGLTETDVEVAQNFGFSTTRDLGADLDMVLPESVDDDDASPTTDVLPAAHVEEHTILEREILPSNDDDDDDDDYDLSMIIDATEDRLDHADVTSKQLKAVEVETVEEALDDEYTLSNEVDYQILEQDYEDELTATQALNSEIAKATEELAARLGEDAAETVANVTSVADDSEVTHVLDKDALEDTGINEELTAELPVDDDEIPGDRTSEVPVATIESRRFEKTGDTAKLVTDTATQEDGTTTEMAVESGHFKTGRA